MTMKTKNLGVDGENFAADYLKSKGYEILEKNFRFGRNAEIDIIAQREDEIIFVEVKTRSNFNLGRPAEAVTIHKQQKIILAAQNFLQLNNFFDRNCRFDVIEIFASNKNFSWTINHIENAFEIS